MHRLLFGVCTALAAAQAAAFGVASLPDSDEAEIRRRHSDHGLVETLIKQIGERAHETILDRSYGCTIEACAGANVPPAVLAGLVWADMPSGRPVRGRWRGCKATHIGLQLDGNLASPVCTVGYLLDGAKRSRGRGREFYGEEYLTLYRTHFGDMQWMHAMAERKGDAAQDTRDSTLGWARYLYQLATPVAADRIAVDLPLSQIASISRSFSGKKRGWNSLTLFATGQDRVDEAIVRDIAFGALLHLVQDSYSESHLARDFSAESAAPTGAIGRFYSYSLQRSECHQPRDADPVRQDGWWESPRGKAVVAAGAKLIEFREGSARVDTVIDWLRNEVFVLAEPTHPADAGFDRACNAG